MGVVRSYTAARIEELLSTIPQVATNQEQLSALVLEIKTLMDAAEAERIELNEEIIPVLRETLSSNAQSVGELRETSMVELKEALEANTRALQSVQEVAIPALQVDVESQYVNLRDAPKVYVQPEPPENPDEDDRYLVVGDVWNDSDDDNRQKIWNGVEWSSFAVDIPDLSLTVRKFNSPRHMIY